MTVLLDRGLPANIDAERFILGSIVLNDDRFADVASVLAGDDFAIRPNTYLVLLSGTEFNLGQATHIVDDVAAFQGNPALSSAYNRKMPAGPNDSRRLRNLLDGDQRSRRRSRASVAYRNRVIAADLRIESRHVSGSERASLDRAGGLHCRTLVPFDQSARTGSGGPVGWNRRSTDREEVGRASGPRCHAVRRAFPKGRTRHERSGGRSLGTLDHEPDGAPQCADGPALHPGR